MKTYEECLAEGFVPSRKYGWFEYKRDYVKHIGKLAERMGFVQEFAYNIKFYKYCLNENKHFFLGYYMGFYDVSGKILPEIRLFLQQEMNGNNFGITHGLLMTTGSYESGTGIPFMYSGVPEEVVEKMFTECTHPDGFKMYLENWKNMQLLETL